MATRVAKARPMWEVEEEEEEEEEDTGGTNKGPAYYGEGSPGFYSITLTKCT